MTSISRSVSTELKTYSAPKSLVSKKSFAGLVLAASVLGITGCQTTQNLGTAPNSTTEMVTGGASQYPALLQSFNIRGKIGVTTPKTETSAAQPGSAFYVWAHEDERFAMEGRIRDVAVAPDGAVWVIEDQSPGRLLRLSPRERQVLELVIASKSNKIIADVLGISIKTVELHRANMMTKLDVRSLPELMKVALGHG